MVDNYISRNHTVNSLETKITDSGKRLETKLWATKLSIIGEPQEGTIT